jgi:DNA (cytosine-5)-methyltransferase 1
MTVVDLFAGARGWDLGARTVGIDPVGVELWGPACRTSAAAGFRTIRADVATFPLAQIRHLEGLIASPPCTDWSAAGGRARRNGETGWLVDEPLRWVAALHPRWVALEQVPPALEVWEQHAQTLRLWGYSVWCGILNAADYGVPQTRQRAILMASLDRPALPPEPTHARDPQPSLFGHQLQPWVTMADALGLDGCVHTNRDQRPDGTRQVVGSDRPAPALTAKSGGQWHLRPGIVEGRNRRLRPVHEPAPTICFGNDAASWVFERPATTVCADPRIAPPGHRDREGGEPQFPDGTVRLTVEQALVLQSFPPDYPLQGAKTERFTQVGNAVPPLLAEKILKAVAA